jgi:biopolymer transport protein ExbD
VNFSARRREEPLVDVTPLIDIIFQLVIFFMVSTTFVTEQGIEVDLPRSSSQTILRERNDVQVKVASDGAIYVDDEAVTWDELNATLKATAAKGKGGMVIIKADQSVDYGRAVAVLDLARSLGLQLALATEANEGGGASGGGAAGGDAGGDVGGE